MTRTELVPPNKTKSTTNDMPRERSDFLKADISKTVFLGPLAQISVKKSPTIYLE